MKRLILCIFFVILFSNFIFASPLNVEFEKENYFFGETVQGKLFIDSSVQEEIKINDFHLESNGSITQIYPNLIEFDEYTYFYFNLQYGLNLGNYSFVVEDVNYINTENILVQEDQFFDINFEQKNGSVININPAIFIISEGTNFNLKFNNPSMTDSFVNISVFDDFISVSDESFLLSSGSNKNIELDIYSMFVDKLETSLLVSYDELSYSIPIILKNFETQDNVSIESGELVILEDSFDISLDLGESISGFFKISNGLGSEINDIKFELSGSISDILDMEFEVLESIQNEEVIKNRIYINEDKGAVGGNYSGKIDLIYSGKIYDSLDLSIKIKSGINEGDLVDLNETFPDDNVEEKDTRINTVIIIILIILAIGLLVYLKYSKENKKDKKTILSSQK